MLIYQRCEGLIWFNLFLIKNATFNEIVTQPFTFLSHQRFMPLFVIKLFHNLSQIIYTNILNIYLLWRTVKDLWRVKNRWNPWYDWDVKDVKGYYHKKVKNEKILYISKRFFVTNPSPPSRLTASKAQPFTNPSPTRHILTIYDGFMKNMNKKIEDT